MFGNLALELVLAVSAVSLSAPVVQTAAQQEEDYILTTISARPEKCNLSVATKVELLTLIKQSEKWSNKCVAVDGYWYYQALFLASHDTRKRYAQSNKALSKRRVGIYGTEELLAAAPKTAKAYTAVGVAGECEALAEGAIMVMGYCHYTGGPYIAVSEMRPR